MMYFDKAYALAEAGHAKQIDKSGKPYFEHVKRVVATAKRLIAGMPPGSITPELLDIILAVAVLHDLVEDESETGVSYEMLEAEGLPPFILDRVRRLDKRFKIGTYLNNIEAIAIEGDIVTIIVKLADNLDNSDPERIAQLPEHERSIKDRYDRVRPFLVAAYEQAGGRYLGA